MPKNKVRYSNENKAIEAFCVLILKKRPTRSYTRSEIFREISRPEIYVNFLKICMEMDQTEDLVNFRNGLLIVLKAIGISSVARETGLSRISIYRMLSKDGNPKFSNMIALLRVLDLHLWIVDYEFLLNGSVTRRYNNKVSFHRNDRLSKEVIRKIMGYSEE